MLGLSPLLSATKYSANQSPTATLYTVHIHNHVHALIPISLSLRLFSLRL